MDKEVYFDTILDKKTKIGICHGCGEIRNHGLRWCKECGGEFCTTHNHTVLEIIAIRSEFYFEVPEFYASVYKRKIQAMGFTEHDFKNYIEKKLD